MKHRYDRDTCLLCAPASVQNYILDRYRLTDGFKSEYIDHMLHTPENENVVMQALSAISVRAARVSPRMTAWRAT